MEEDRLTIDYEKRDGVAYIKLNNPFKANILDKQTSDAIPRRGSIYGKIARSAAPS